MELTQFDAVLSAFAGARILRPTISAAYSHVSPSDLLTACLEKNARSNSTEEANGEERVEDEEQDSRHNLGGTVVDGAEDSEENHRGALASRTDEDEGATAHTVDEINAEEGREEVLSPVAGSDDTRVYV